MMSNLKNNLKYQTAYQILITVTPLITAPYLSRVLGAENQGLYSYRLSLANYFVLVAMLGVTTYGTKTIAENCRERRHRDKLFGNLAFVQCSFGLMVLLAYTLFVIFVCKCNKVSSIMIFSVLACLVDFNWFFYGNEKFKITTTIHATTKVLTTVCILMFVKQETDLLKYVAIMSCSTFASNVALVPFIKKEIHFSNLSLPNCEEFWFYLKKDAILFIPIIAQTIYHVMDKTMLGMMSEYNQVGYYYNADKLINIPVGILAGACTVLLPRMSTIIASGNYDKKIDTFRTTIQAITCISSSFCFGIMGIADEFVPLFYGEGYVPCILLVKGLAVVIVLKSISEGLKTQYLIPNENNKCFIIAVFAGCIANIIANTILIPRLDAMGAVIGTIIAEGIAMTIPAIFICHKEKLFGDIFYCLGFILIGTIMEAAVDAVSLFENCVWLKVGLKIAVGVFVYVLLTYIYILCTPRAVFSCKVKKIVISRIRGGGIR